MTGGGHPAAQCAGLQGSGLRRERALGQPEHLLL